VGMNEAALRLAGEKMWSTSVARAAERLEVWWNMAVPRSNGGQEVDGLTETNGAEDQLEMLPWRERQRVFTTDHLSLLGKLSQ
jgi:hypothetical protein